VLNACASVMATGPLPTLPRKRGRMNLIVLAPRFARECCQTAMSNCHCEEPTGPARSGRPDDRLHDEAIQNLAAGLDCFASLAMTKERKAERRQSHCRQSRTQIRRAARATEGAACAALPLSGALACRRSTTALAKGCVVPWCDPGQASWANRPRGGGHSADDRPTSSDAPRTPVIVPAGMMPGPPGSKADDASPAGTAPAPNRPASPGRRPLRGEIIGSLCNERGDGCQGGSR